MIAPFSEQSIKLYGTALKEKNIALRDSVQVQTDEPLAGGKLMAGYEVPQSRTASVPRPARTGADVP